MYTVTLKCFIRVRRELNVNAENITKYCAQTRLKPKVWVEVE